METELGTNAPTYCRNRIGKLWAMAAAATGDSNAQYNYAVRLQNGDGGQTDLRRAIRYYRLSARQGNSDAQCDLAVAIIEGNGMKKGIYNVAAIRD